MSSSQFRLARAILARETDIEWQGRRDARRVATDLSGMNAMHQQSELAMHPLSGISRRQEYMGAVCAG